MESSELGAVAAAFANDIAGNSGDEEMLDNQEPGQADAEQPALESEGENDQQSDEGEGQPEVVTVEVDGKTMELTKAELAEAVKGQMRQSDYTKKTMEAAELRKTADTEIQQARQQRVQFAQQLEHTQIVLANALQEQSKINWQELLDSDPVEYLKQQHLYQQRQAEFQTARQQSQQLEQHRQTEQQAEAKKFIADQHDQLVAKIPEWKDEAKAKSGKAEVRDYLMKDFTADEVSTLCDHRHVVLARKAMMFDQMIEKAKAAGKKIENVPQRVQRAGSGANPNASNKQNDAMKRLGKTGSINDAASLFSQLI